MRLLKLKIKNIASLKGEHLVDFEAIQSMSSLFAITGETGAGKSSILNSIGLSLYGKNFKGLYQPDLVTLGEKEAEVQLLFQVAGKYYLADWKARVRGRNGEPLKVPQMERNIFPLEGKDFAAIRGAPVDSVERLLNLTFDQFCKCIILNQGEFARFLSSSFSERKEILEKLYPGELLDNLGKELKSQVDGLDRDKSEIEIKLGELQGEAISGEELKLERERLKHELAVHQSWQTKVEGLEYHFISLFSYYEKWHDYQKKARELKAEINRAQSAYNECLKESEVVVEAFEGARLKQEKELPRLQELLKKEEALKHLSQSSQDLSEKIKALESKIQVLTQTKSENAKKVATWKDSHAKLQTSFKYPIRDLKAARSELESAFEIFHKTTTLLREEELGQEKLKELETIGKELGAEVAQLLKKIEALPANLKDELAKLENKKSELTKLTEERQKAQYQKQELIQKLIQQEKEAQELEERIKSSASSLITYEQEFLALETTVKLQELTAAVETCLSHAQKNESQNCPVCETTIAPARWQELIQHLNKANMQEVKARTQELSHLIIQLQAENKLASSHKLKLLEEIKVHQSTLTELEKLQLTPLPSMSELEGEIGALKQKEWELEKLKLDEQKKNLELNKARENYLKSRNRHQELAAELSKLQEELKLRAASSKGLLSYPIKAQELTLLKEDLRLLHQFIECESQGEKLLQEESFTLKELKTREQEKEERQLEEKQLIERMQELKLLLQRELLGKSAKELIDELGRKLKELTEQKEKSDKILKQHDDIIKDCRGKLYSVEEQLKEYDLLFVKKLHEIKEVAATPLPEIKEELSSLVSRLQNLALDFMSPKELFVPVKEVLTLEKESLKETCNELRERGASVAQRLSDWEKRQDKIKILQISKAELESKWQRLKRLQEVLGQDNLRTFVLSLVEENLISQTNEELQKLCQGRYEIIHQSKGKRETPEFYILDKFREGGSRKVSTLSGGETFMVSLAMALALAEMTRGQAEIDSLFIDEGFGTLDQDSLQDVLDVLNQIQTRGLMVGIISHIKALTNSIPVNLVLSKKQDGTSSVSVQSN